MFIPRSFADLSICLWLFYFTLLPAALCLVVQDPSRLVVVSANISTSSLSYAHLNTSAVEMVQTSPKPWPFVLGGFHENVNLSSAVQLAVLPRPNVRYQCNNQLFSLDVADCRQVWRDLPKFDVTYSFGNRSAPRSWDVPLPMRWISRRWIGSFDILH